MSNTTKRRGDTTHLRIAEQQNDTKVMPARTAARPERELDLSNVGKAGRRTGVTLAPRRVDEYGLEEVSGIFSSPHKQSPLKQIHSSENILPQRNGNTKTPARAGSAHRRSLRNTSIPPPRSASPRKSGITGTARRSNILRAQDESPDKENEHTSRELQKSRTPLQQPPIRPLSIQSAAAKRFSPDRTPLRDQVLNGKAKSAHVPRQSYSLVELESAGDAAPDDTPSRINIDDEVPTRDGFVDDYEPYVIADEPDEVENHASTPSNHDESALPVQDSVEIDEDVHPYFPSTKKLEQSARIPTVANSRRKRKSDVVEEEETPVISSPTAKRAKGRVNTTENARSKSSSESVSQESPPREAPPAKKKRGPHQKKDPQSKHSARQESDLGQIVERVKARPGPKKSLYILRRETPADEGVGRTRSGRLTVKPLAWWKNERCVWSNSPGSASLADGARFPLNSIKEIIRNEQVDVTPIRKKPRSKSNQTNKRKARTQSQEDDNESATEDESGDPNAEPWELDVGTYRGSVTVWDSEYNGPVPDEEEEIDLAYAPAAIETKEVKNSKFRYAKLLSTKFFGSGIVDLPPGEMKRIKPTQKMHMSFFVATGRVTVTVAPANEQGVDMDRASRFSVGKGGFWQVPRGNYYAIENELEKPARMFFSQACEMTGDGE